METKIGKVREYGQRPRNIVLVHGGPGAWGEMRPVALQLAKTNGVIEPFQTGITLHSEIEELRTQIEKYADQPVILVGFSWGAWLVGLVAAKYPELVEKIILVSSGPLDKRYVDQMRQTRKERLECLPAKEKGRMKEIESILKDDKKEKTDEILNEYGSLMGMIDSYSRRSDIEPTTERAQMEIYERIWPEADKMRRMGELLAKFATIKCPVVSIHGDYDPHPADGVRIPLEHTDTNFKQIIIKRAGHKIWEENYGEKPFYDALFNEIS
ncbi:MAG: alpha/beta hydrolase [bacterium]